MGPERDQTDGDPEIAGIRLSELPDLARTASKKHQALVDRLKSEDGELLDEHIHAAHREEFRSIDCLQCANCCKTTPALVQPEDIDRIAAHLHLSNGEFLKKYVLMDEDGDFVLHRTPCAFLGDGNACTIYEVRPAACRAYPLTGEPRQKAMLHLAPANAAICPAVYRILEKLEGVFPA